MALKKFIVDISRQLRRNQTPQEKQLWGMLRNRKLLDLKFLRQHPIVFGGTEEQPAFFVLDFYCAEKRLVLEIDGGIHEFQKEYDKGRDEILEEMDLVVLRIQNDELKNMASVLTKIQKVVLSLPSHVC